MGTGEVPIGHLKGERMDSTEFRKIPAEERLDKSSERAIDHLTRKKRLNSRQKVHARMWAMEAAHESSNCTLNYARKAL